jgi:hypothetical protein
MTQQVFNISHPVTVEETFITLTTISLPAGESLLVTARFGVLDTVGYEGLTEATIRADTSGASVFATTTAFSLDATLGTITASDANRSVDIILEGTTAVPEEEGPPDVYATWINFFFGSELPAPPPAPTPSLVASAPLVRRTAFSDHEGRAALYVTPGESLPLVFDWTNWLDGEAISASTWTSVGTTLTEESFAGSTVTCIASGAAGYATNQITTSTGRISPKVRMILRLDPRV